MGVYALFKLAQRGLQVELLSACARGALTVAGKWRMSFLADACAAVGLAPESVGVPSSARLWSEEEVVEGAPQARGGARGEPRQGESTAQSSGG